MLFSFQEFQYVANINGKNVLDMSYVVVENLIVDGPGLLEMTLFEKKDTENVNSSPGEQVRLFLLFIFKIVLKVN